MQMREEQDTLGPVEVPEDKFWGAQTQRSLENFQVGEEKFPPDMIHALALIKKAAAIVNAQLGILPKEKKSLIVEACDRILKGEFSDEFPLSVWQTGSGTQTNMNVNEVISNIANKKAGHPLGSKKPIHPNDDVNKSQSSNDVFPSAMHIAALTNIKRTLLPHLNAFYLGFMEKAKDFHHIIKIGRTHLMDATPLTLGQEFSGYASQIGHGIKAIEKAMGPLAEIALGGTAVGTGINAPPEYALKVAETISELTGITFISAPNKFEALAASDAIVEMSGALRRVACSIIKIANDIRLLASGPRCGIAEIVLPANEPGSSIMPGKVNPTQCESITQVMVQIFGNDTAIAFAGSQGNFELNVYRPLMIYNLLQSIRLLGDSALNFYQRCLIGIRPNEKRIEDLLQQSLMLVTALSPIIGYEKAAQIAKKAYQEDITLKEATLALKILSEEEFDRIVDPKKMVSD